LTVHLPVPPLRPARRLLLAAALLLCCGLLLSSLPVYAQDGGTMIYTVQAGETLTEIAAQFGVDPATLLELNGLEDADAIFVGQTLRVPVQVDAAQPAPPGTHRVQPGETLSEIAKLYGMTLEELMALNQIEDSNAVYAGQLLAIGAAAQNASAAASQDTSSDNTADSTEAEQTGSDETAAPPVDDTPTVAPEPTQEPTAVTAIPDVHVVQAGETLTGIARRYGIPAATIKALNNLGDADYIVVGQELILSVAALPPTATPTATSTEEPTLAPTTAATEPPQEAATATPGATLEATLEAAAATPETIPPTHTVQAGETLTGIARRYGLTLGALQALNGIDDENAIYVGQELTLLAPTPEPTAGPPPNATEELVSGEDASLEGVTPEPPAATPAPIVRSGNPAASLNQTYTIGYGDTLGRIALRLGLDADALTSLNGFDSVDAPLNAGATLLLPATGDELRPSTPAQEHVVSPGESLSAIAQSYGVDTADLMAANGISDPNAIYSGQRLLIPSQPLGGGGVLQQLGPASSGYFFYTVQPGDTLSAIAKQFDSTMEALRTYNGLPDNETVYTGLELKIPFGPPALPLNLPPVPMSGTRFVISLSRQQCWVFEGDKVRYAWNCSTGQADRKTKPGNFAVQSKIPNAKSKVWKLDMPYWLGIYDVGEVENGIHGLPMAWSSGKKIWSGLIGQPATFGCAMLDDANASTLYRMAFLGMPVHIVN